MTTLRIAIIADSGECSELSALCAQSFLDALRMDFPQSEIVPVANQLEASLRNFSPHLAIVSWPLRNVTEAASVISILDRCHVPYVGRRRSFLPAARPERELVDLQTKSALTEVLEKLGVSVAETFYIDDGYDLAGLAKYQGAISPAERDLSVAVLDDPSAPTLPIVETVQPKIPGGIASRLYTANDYENIYVCPALLDTSVAVRARDIASILHQIGGCADLSRTDLMLKDGVLTVKALHVRPILSPGSLFFKAVETSGSSLADLLWHLVSQAAASTYGVLDIKSEGESFASVLSNFCPYPFVFDGIPCASMEGLLQSLKYPNPDDQRRLCGLAGAPAKHEGAKRNAEWQGTQTLFWQGITMDRHSPAYQQFLDRAYRTLFDQNDAFRAALSQSGQHVLRHTVGSKDPTATVLTEREFIRRLNALRNPT